VARRGDELLEFQCHTAESAAAKTATHADYKAMGDLPPGDLRRTVHVAEMVAIADGCPVPVGADRIEGRTSFGNDEALNKAAIVAGARWLHFHCSRQGEAKEAPRIAAAVCIQAWVERARVRLRAAANADARRLELEARGRMAAAAVRIQTVFRRLAATGWLGLCVAGAVRIQSFFRRFAATGWQGVCVAAAVRIQTVFRRLAATGWLGLCVAEAVRIQTVFRRLAATGWLGLFVAAAVRIQSFFRRFAAKRQAAALATVAAAALAAAAAASLAVVAAAATAPIRLLAAATQRALLGGSVAPALTAAVFCTAPPGVAAPGQAPAAAQAPASPAAASGVAAKKELQAAVLVQSAQRARAAVRQVGGLRRAADKTFRAARKASDAATEAANAAGLASWIRLQHAWRARRASNLAAAAATAQAHVLVRTNRAGPAVSPTARPPAPAVAAPVPAAAALSATAAASAPTAVVVRAGGRSASGRGAIAGANRAKATGAPPGGTPVAAPVVPTLAPPLLPPWAATPAAVEAAAAAVFAVPPTHQPTAAAPGAPPPAQLGGLAVAIATTAPIVAARFQFSKGLLANQETDKANAQAVVVWLGGRALDDAKIAVQDLRYLLRVCRLVQKLANKEAMVEALHGFLEFAGVVAPGEAAKAAARKKVAQAMKLVLAAGVPGLDLRLQCLADAEISLRHPKLKQMALLAEFVEKYA
jgi:hypothetical protein